MTMELAKDDLSNEWAYDIIEYCQSYYGVTKNYKKIFKLFKEITDIATELKSFNSFGDFLGYHNPKYHETNKFGNYRNLWWGNVAFLLNKTSVVEKDGVDENFVYEIIGIFDFVIDERK